MAGSTPTGRGRRARRLAKRTVFTLLIWLAFAGLLELGVRLLVPAPLRGYHPWLGTHIRPGAQMRHVSPQRPPEFDQQLRYNRQGFRDVEHTTPKRPGVFRIAVLGDSIVEARQVALEETFCRLLADRLNRDSRQRYEVINLGSSGAGPLLASLIYRHVPTATDADLVLMVCFPNDVSDDARFEPLVERDAEGLPNRIPTPPGRLPLPPRAKRWLRSHSRAWAYFGTTLSAALQRMRRVPPALDPAQPARDDFAAARGRSSQQLDSAWKLVSTNLRDLQRLAQQRGARFGLIAVPLGSQILSRPEWEQGRKVHQLARGGGADFQQRLAGIAAQHRFPVLDLLEPFESAQGTLYFPYDGHLTAAGHRLAASKIAEWLARSGMLRGPNE